MQSDTLVEKRGCSPPNSPNRTHVVGRWNGKEWIEGDGFVCVSTSHYYYIDYVYCCPTGN